MTKDNPALRETRPGAQPPSLASERTIALKNAYERGIKDGLKLAAAQREASVAEQPTPQSALAQVQDLIGHHWDDDTYSAGWLARKIDAAINPLKSGAGR